MRSSMLLVAAVTCLWLAAPISVVRAADDNANSCVNGSGDQAIAACTRMINSGLFSGEGLAAAYGNRGNDYEDRGDHDRAIADYNQAIQLDPRIALAYYNRGAAYHAKGDDDRAITDFNQAIQLDPKNASVYFSRGDAYEDKSDNDKALADYSQAIQINPGYANAYVNRGFAYNQKGDTDHAIADYSQAIELDPKNAGAFFNRGLANLYAGALPNSLADLNQASELSPKYPYAALWLDIVGQRSNLPSRLPQAVTEFDMTLWPAPVIRMFLGQMTPAAVLAAADNPDAIRKKGQVCEANFYGGEFSLRQGAKDEAVRLFNQAVAVCPTNFVEWSSANAELKAPGAAPSAASKKPN